MKLTARLFETSEGSFANYLAFSYFRVLGFFIFYGAGLNRFLLSSLRKLADFLSFYYQRLSLFLLNFRRQLRFFLIAFAGGLRRNLLGQKAFLILDPGITHDLGSCGSLLRIKGKHALDKILEFLTEKAFWLKLRMFFPELFDMIATFDKILVPSVVSASLFKGHGACPHAKEDGAK